LSSGTGTGPRGPIASFTASGEGTGSLQEGKAIVAEKNNNAAMLQERKVFINILLMIARKDQRFAVKLKIRFTGSGMLHAHTVA
jgi:hypothetical protein